MPTPADAVTVVIPVHNAADRVDRVVGWRTSLEKGGRPFEILVVDDGSTDATAARLAGVAHTRVLKHDTRRGFGTCLRTALAEAKHPLFFYTALDYPYTPSDIRRLLERIDLRDELLGKQPDLISGCRTGLEAPGLVTWGGRAWRLFLRLFAGMPSQDPPPWHGWAAYRHRVKAKWVYGVPLADVNSCFKLFRTAFLKRFPIQSDGDFVHTELVAKATFLTSIMDEVPLTPKPDPVPLLGDTAEDRSRVSATRAKFAFPPPAAEPARPQPTVPEVPKPTEPTTNGVPSPSKPTEPVAAVPAPAQPTTESPATTPPIAATPQPITPESQKNAPAELKEPKPAEPSTAEAPVTKAPVESGAATGPSAPDDTKAEVPVNPASPSTPEPQAVTPEPPKSAEPVATTEPSEPMKSDADSTPSTGALKSPTPNPSPAPLP